MAMKKKSISAEAVALNPITGHEAAILKWDEKYSDLHKQLFQGR